MYMKEYAIYCIVNGGCPYIAPGSNFKSFDAVLSHLYSRFISSCEERNVMYFVDNEFFNNKYSNMPGVKNFNYYKIVVREYSEWVKADSKGNFVIQNNNYYNDKNKVINFCDFA